MTGWRVLVLSCVLFAALSSVQTGTSAAQSAEKGVIGVGLIIGEPLGVSAKLYLSDDTALDAAVGGAILGGGIQAHADFLWHPWVLENRSNFVLPAYVGAGLRVLNHRAGTVGDFHIGIRAVAGLLFDFKTVPLDVFVEVAPSLDYIIARDDPDHAGFAIGVSAGLGARYYF